MKKTIIKSIGLLVVTSFVIFILPIHFNSTNGNVEVLNVEAGAKKLGGNKYKVTTGGKTVYVKTAHGSKNAVEKARKAIANGKVGKGCSNVTKNPSRDWGWTPGRPTPTPTPTGGGGGGGDGDGDGDGGGHGGGGGYSGPPSRGVPGTIIDGGYYDNAGDLVVSDTAEIGDFKIDASLTNNQCTLSWESTNATYCELVNRDKRTPVSVDYGPGGLKVGPGLYQLYCENEYSGDSIITNPPLKCISNLDFREI